MVKKIDNLLPSLKNHSRASACTREDSMSKSIDEIIKSIKQTKLFADRPIYSEERLQTIEKSIGFTFPEDYRSFVTRIEPELANFYFIDPHRSKKNADLVIFSRWNDDRFAFRKNGEIATILNDEETGHTWKNFTDWLLYVWGMSNRPVNPE